MDIGKTQIPFKDYGINRCPSCIFSLFTENRDADVGCVTHFLWGEDASCRVQSGLDTEDREDSHCRTPSPAMIRGVNSGIVFNLVPQHPQMSITEYAKIAAPSSWPSANLCPFYRGRLPKYNQVCTRKCISDSVETKKRLNRGGCCMIYKLVYDVY